MLVGSGSKVQLVKGLYYGFKKKLMELTDKYVLD